MLATINYKIGKKNVPIMIDVIKNKEFSIPTAQGVGGRDEKTSKPRVLAVPIRVQLRHGFSETAAATKLRTMAQINYKIATNSRHCQKLEFCGSGHSVMDE